LDKAVKPQSARPVLYLLLGILSGLTTGTCMAKSKPAQTWHELKKTNKLFARNPKLKHRRTSIVQGQTPCAVVLTCADSRVVPEYIFDQTLGDLFVVRVAGNVVDNLVLDSIEFAVKHFKPALIIVLGHSGCAAVAGAVSHLQKNNGVPDIPHDHFGAVLIPIEQAILKAGVDISSPHANEKAIKANIAHAAHYLPSHSSIIKQALEQKIIQIVGAVYSLETGLVTESLVMK
jgi:carbonic anhydrase